MFDERSSGIVRSSGFGPWRSNGLRRFTRLAFAQAIQNTRSLRGTEPLKAPPQHPLLFRVQMLEAPKPQAQCFALRRWQRLKLPKAPQQLPAAPIWQLLPALKPAAHSAPFPTVHARPALCAPGQILLSPLRQIWPVVLVTRQYAALFRRQVLPGQCMHRGWRQACA